MVIKLRPGQPKKGHGFGRISSVTCVTLKWDGREVARVEAWREENDLGPFDLTNVDIHECVAKFHPTAFREIACAVANLPRVIAVKVLTDMDKGIFVEN